MDDMGIGAGLAAMAFWGFVAVVVVGGMWYSIREKEIKQETLRRLIESGQNLDDEMIDKLSVNATSDNLDRDLKVSGLILLPTAVGLGIFGIILGMQQPEAMAPMIGAAVMMVCIGAGLLYAGQTAARWRGESR